MPSSETPWVWSPVTTTSVSGLFLANSRATPIAWSNSMVSTTARSMSSGWLILSIEAPSTIRKKPFSFFDSRSSAVLVMSARPGWPGNVSTVPFFRNSRSSVTSMLPVWNRPRSLPSAGALASSVLSVASA
ncbi:hypothetical protein D3C87_1391030 [compost metagenome]